jgi:hypothetical protein
MLTSKLSRGEYWCFMVPSTLLAPDLPETARVVSTTLVLSLIAL